MELPDSEQLGANRIWREPGIRRWIGSLGLCLGFKKRCRLRGARASIAHQVGFEFKVREPQKRRLPANCILR